MILCKANQDDVLREQLDHLILARTDARYSNQERSRLDRVAKILLEPFDEPVPAFTRPLRRERARGAA